MIPQGRLPPQNDDTLAEAALQGDRDAYGKLVCRYYEQVSGLVYRMCGDHMLSEDTAQEAFIKAWQRLHTYKSGGSFRNWIFSIAANQAIDLLRRQRKHDPLDDLALQTTEGRPELEPEVKERAATLQAAVLDLPPASRAVLVLREYEEMSYQEIAATLEIPVGTVMSRLNYARQALRQSLATYLESE
jgi:RNA polymerase sigma-70 factor, ECF subfamily